MLVAQFTTFTPFALILGNCIWCRYILWV